MHTDQPNRYGEPFHYAGRTPDHTDAATWQPSDYGYVTTADLAEICVALGGRPATLQVSAVLGRVRAELANRSAVQRRGALLAAHRHNQTA